MNTESIKGEEVKNIPEVEETTAETTAEANTPAEETAEDLLVGEKDRYSRSLAEFESYEKRTVKERVELFKTAGQGILSAMLPIVNGFDRTLVKLSRSSDKNTLMGVEFIYSKLMTTLKQKGLEKMEVAPNDVLDSEHHGVVTQIPVPTPDAKDKVIDVAQTGYELGGKTICPPKVVVVQ